MDDLFVVIISLYKYRLCSQLVVSWVVNYGVSYLFCILEKQTFQRDL